MWTTSTGPRSPGGEGTCSFSLGMKGLCRNRASGRAGRALLRHPPPPPPSRPASTAGPWVVHQSPSPASPRPVLCALLCRLSGTDGARRRPRHNRLLGVRPQASDNCGQCRSLPGRKGCGGSQGRPCRAVCSARQRAPAQGRWRLCCGTPPPPSDQACTFKGCHAEANSVRTGTSAMGEQPHAQPSRCVHTRHTRTRAQPSTRTRTHTPHAHTTRTPRNQDTRTFGSRERQVTLWVPEAGQVQNLAGAQDCLAGEVHKVYTGINGNNGIRRVKKYMLNRVRFRRPSD